MHFDRLIPLAALALVVTVPSLAADAPPSDSSASSAAATPQGAPASAAAAEPAAAGAEPLQEVVVTGSRLSAAFAAPTPVEVITSAQLQQTSPNDIATALEQAPALSSSILASNAGAGSGSNGTNGQSLLNLRGLGINRTLVLLDGERLGTTNVQDSIDINMIPQNLVKRVDIVTGGASASYGSDAVAGVVNFILDTTYQGFKADVSAGTTTYGDATNGTVSVAFGKAFGDNFRLIAGADLFKQGEVGLPPTGRSWDDNPYGAQPNPTAGALPSTLVIPDARSSVGTYGGLITGVTGCKTASCLGLVNQQFGTGGVLQPFVQGANAGASWASGGNGAYVVYGLSPTINRENAFVHAEWDVQPSLTLFSEGLFDRTYTSLAAQPSYATGTTSFTIFPTNAYLPAPVAAVFAANPSLTSFTLARYMPDLTDADVNTTEEVGRVAVGAKGKINERWSFDTSLAQQYTVNNLDITNPIERNLYAAADAVMSNGQVVCASALTGATPGCVPVNLFGPNSVSQAARNYIVGDNRGDTVFKQTAFETNLRGDLGDSFSLGAGPISVATGLAYRHDSADRHVDALSDIITSCTGVPGCPAAVAKYGGYQYYNPSPLYGSTSATEAYAELGIPLLRALPLVKSLDADIAGRMTDYNISGFEDTWKLGLHWAVDNSIMLRGTLSEDIRAPDVLELFSTGSTTVAQDLFPNSTAATQYKVSGVNATVGNPTLQPEIAHTSTGGIVLSPTWVPGWQTSVDYYQINLDHAIESLSFQGIIDGCSQNNAYYCSLITLNGAAVTSTAGITNTTTGLVVTGPTANVGNEHTSGIDLDSDYTTHLAGGTFSAHLIGNYLLTEVLPTASTGCAQYRLVGAIGGCLGANGFPRWKGSVSLQYETGPFSAFVQERLIDSGRADPWDLVGVTISRNAVPSVHYTDLNLTYNLGFHDKGQIYLNVTNLLNLSPPETVTTGRAYISPTSFDLYDVLGRRFVLGYRLSL